MKKLSDIAETDSEKVYIKDLVNSIRAYTSDSIKVLKTMEKERKYGPDKVAFKERQASIELQRKINSNLYVLFQKMHQIIDFPSFVILEDELKKQYENSDK